MPTEINGLYKNTKVAKSEKVKPCPFCGADESFLTLMVADREICYIKCCECGAESGKCAESEDAVEAWNRREG